MAVPVVELLSFTPPSLPGSQSPVSLLPPSLSLMSEGSSLPTLFRNKVAECPLLSPVQSGSESLGLSLGATPGILNKDSLPLYHEEFCYQLLNSFFFCQYWGLNSGPYTC
jgi:hypothetical protein